jgi:hypothetical protein
MVCTKDVHYFVVILIYMQNWLNETKTHMRDRNFLASLGAGLLVLGVSLVINYYAGMYATAHASSSVTDIVLSNIRVYDVDGFFVYGSIIFWIFLIGLMVFRPKRAPFALKSLALFVFIRAIFITLTHIGPFPSEVVLSSDLISKFTFGGDLFFSGHTGLPFLMALVFWQDKIIRYLFIATSIFFAVVVLLGHLHYSIDVLGAFFITYTIFHLSELVFKKDRKLFLS